MYNYVKVETGQNFPPVLKIVTRTAQAAYNVNVAMRARDQCSIFSIDGKFRPDYGLLLELHTLTLVARSYALLNTVNAVEGLVKLRHKIVLGGSLEVLLIVPCMH